MKRALLTGVTGFVGSHLARTLISQGVEVHALIRSTARTDRIPDLIDHVALHVDDGTAKSVETAVAIAAPESTFHLATKFVAEHTPDDITAMVASNVTFPTRLLDALTRRNDAGAFVNAGTAWQHVQSSRYRPKNLYAATKQAFEDVIRFFVDHAGLRAVTVNLSDTYGPADHRDKLVALLINSLRSGEPIAMGSGSQVIDLVHVDDVVQALLAAAAIAGSPGDTPPTGGWGEPIYAVSSGRSRTVRSVVETIGQVAGRPVPAIWGARPDRTRGPLDPWDAGPLVPGWTPTITLEAGLAELLDRGT